MWTHPNAATFYLCGFIICKPAYLKLNNNQVTTQSLQKSIMDVSFIGTGNGTVALHLPKQYSSPGYEQN
jgi:hypothetical protein